MIKISIQKKQKKQQKNTNNAPRISENEKLKKSGFVLFKLAQMTPGANISYCEQTYKQAD